LAFIVERRQRLLCGSIRSAINPHYGGLSGSGKAGPTNSMVAWSVAHYFHFPSTVLGETIAVYVNRLGIWTPILKNPMAVIG
jgi:hypothetical protein